MAAARRGNQRASAGGAGALRKARCGRLPRLRRGRPIRSLLPCAWPLGYAPSMKRGKPLQPDPEKVRAWQERSRERARQRPQQPRSGFKPKASIPPIVRRRVYARSAGRCIRPGCGSRCVHIHHILDQQAFPDLALVEDNMVGTCAHCNWAHHFAPNQRFPRSAIPACSLRLAEVVGAKALQHIRRYYPD